MAKEDLVASIKTKNNNLQVKQLTDLNSTIQELFYVDDSDFRKEFDGFSVNFSCQDVEEYIESLTVPIHLIVTSPPYNCNIKYDSYDDNRDWQDYENWLIKIFSASFDKQVEGGRVVLNFPFFVKGETGRKSLSSIYERVLIKSGYEIVDFITWVKAKDEKEAVGSAGRSTAWGSWMSPSSPNVRPISELILIARKPGKFTSQNSEVTITTEEFKSYTISAWFLNGASSKHHPATFPPELAARAIKLYSYKFDNIFDPFMGIGSTTVACQNNYRNFYGCDISKKYIRVAASRL